MSAISNFIYHRPILAFHLSSVFGAAGRRTQRRVLRESTGLKSPATLMIWQHWRVEECSPNFRTEAPQVG